ncbi:MULTISPECIES: hypothetical protein, partial [Leptolyngbya]|uniref:hypothetical protein n=2 Tax=Leptolyngbya group TaxID=3081713 RepID=UPI001A7EFE4E
ELPLQPVIKVPMPRPTRPLFPDHKFDFGDPAWVVPIQQGGTIEAIWYRQNDDAWLYRLTGLSQPEKWWHEEKLENACPDCGQSWSGTRTCQCGRSPDE